MPQPCDAIAEKDMAPAKMLILFLAADIWSAGKISVLGEDNKWCLRSVHACVAMIYRQCTQV